MSSKEETKHQQTQKVILPPPSPEETALLNQQIQIAKIITGQLETQGALFEDVAAAIEPLIAIAQQDAEIRQQVLTPEVQQQIIENEVALQQANVDFLKMQLESSATLEPERVELLQQQIAAAEADLQRAQGVAPLTDEALRKQIEILNQGGVPTPEQQAFLDEQARRAIESGRSDIMAFQEESIRLLREELAPSLGLRPGDTPIIDRGGLIAREGLRQFGQLQSNVLGAKAGALGGLISQNQGIANAFIGLQSSLADQAQRNRIALAASLNPQAQPTTAGEILNAPNNTLNSLLGLSLGFAQTPTGIPQTLAGLEQLRLGSATINTSGTSTTTSSPGFASILGGLGGLLTGVGSLPIKSAEALKESIVKPRSALDILSALAIREWSYIGDKVRHIGPMAEQWKKITGLGDGKTIFLGDVLFLLVKAFQEREANA